MNRDSHLNYCATSFKGFIKPRDRKQSVFKMWAGEQERIQLQRQEYVTANSNQTQVSEKDFEIIHDFIQNPVVLKLG